MISAEAAADAVIRVLRPARVSVSGDAALADALRARGVAVGTDPIDLAICIDAQEPALDAARVLFSAASGLPMDRLQWFAAHGFAPRTELDASGVAPGAMLFERAEAAPRAADLQAAALLVQARLDLAAAQTRIMDATVVSHALRARAEAAEMRAAAPPPDPAERDALRAELERVSEAHRQVLASSSWRATAALRRLGRLLPTGKRRRLRQAAKLLWWSATLQLPQRHRQWQAARALPPPEPAPLAPEPPAPPAPMLPEAARFGADARFPGYRTPPRDRYEAFRFARAAASRAECRVDGLFSLVTTVWNTDPAYLLDLAECVLGQQGAGAFEWVLLDNGSVRDDTRAALARIAARAPGLVRFERADANLGIVGGMRWCLEHARNRYIVPLDSDDLLTPDALAALGAGLQQAGFPALAYTDEDKLEGDRFREPYCKPDWDPVLFAHSCYIAHLCAIDREQALGLGAYRSASAEGSHDWDTFTRFWLAGHTPLHVAALVYSWRMHPHSTAGNIYSKSTIFASQKAATALCLSRLVDAVSYRIEHSPLFGVSPDWRIVREWPEPPPTIALAGSLTELARAAEAVDSEFVHLLDPAATIDAEGWADEALTLLHVFADAAIVGGCVHRHGRVVLADGYEHFGAGWQSPNTGRALTDPGYFAQLWKPHSADVVPVEHCVVRRDFLLRALAAAQQAGGTLSGLPGWLGVWARREAMRAVFSPFLRCTMAEANAVAPWEREAVRLAFARVPARARLLSPQLGLTPQTAYLPVPPAERAAQETRPELDYPAQHRAELAARLATPGTATCRFSLLTTLYAGSQAPFLREAFASISQQTLPPHEWIVLVKGKVAPDLSDALAEISAPWLRVLTSDELSIIAGMRLCLEQATGDYVMPMDYDDVLTIDALSTMAAAIAVKDRPGLVYSDEDTITAEGLRAPYRRAPFDPVLNATDSSIWHLCAFQRERALALGVYTAAEAEFCHDWDTVTRFADAGERIAHVPEVLYHWRMHAASTSNSGEVNQGSLTSVQAMLARRVARQTNPEHYDVAPWPIQRGFEQYTILRRPVGPLPIGAAITLVLGEGVETPEPAALWEGVRLFEMHDDVGAVGGRIVDADGMVIETCTPMRGGPWAGRHRIDGGDYAHVLKPQTMAALSAGLFLCRAEVSGGDAAEVAARCRARGWRLAYSPLIEARHHSTVCAKPASSV